MRAKYRLTSTNESGEHWLKVTANEAKKMQAAGGITQADFTTLLAKGGMKPSASSIKAFNAMDKNKDGKIDESEANAEGGGEDYSFWSWLKGFATHVLEGVATYGAIAAAGAAIAAI